MISSALVDSEESFIRSIISKGKDNNGDGGLITLLFAHENSMR